MANKDTRDVNQFYPCKDCGKTTLAYSNFVKNWICRDKNCGYVEPLPVRDQSKGMPTQEEVNKGIDNTKQGLKLEGPTEEPIEDPKEDSKVDALVKEDPKVDVSVKEELPTPPTPTPEPPLAPKPPKEEKKGLGESQVMGGI